MDPKKAIPTSALSKNHHHHHRHYCIAVIILVAASASPSHGSLAPPLHFTIDDEDGDDDVDGVDDDDYDDDVGHVDDGEDDFLNFTWYRKEVKNI